MLGQVRFAGRRQSAPGIAGFLVAVLLGLGRMSAAGQEIPQKIAPDRIGPRTQPVRQSDYQEVRHVAQATGSDRSGDGSARKPWTTIPHALSRITDAGPSRRYAVLIAGGTYRGVLALKPYVDLYGGFESQGWSRDIAAHASVLDGQKKDRLVLGADNARLDGFVLTRGQARGPGGAVLCDGTSPTLSNNVFTQNGTLEPAGYLHHLLHQVGNDGGAVACLNGAMPLITNCLFADNTTEIGGGGGVACRNLSLPVIVNSVFFNNRTGLTDRSRTRSSNGGAISCSNALPKVMEKENVTYRARIVNNIIANNRVGGNSDAGGVYCEYDSSVEITNNYLVGNAAEDDGGAIYVMKSSEPTIAGNVIAGNAGKGAIRLSKEGRARIEGNLIAANDGGVTCGDSWMTLAHNVIVGNAGYGVAYSNNRLPHVKPSLLTHNLICANTGAQIIVEAPEPPVVTHSRVQGGYAGDGNTDASPVFLDDGAQGTAAAVAFDPGRFLTTISLPAARFETGELAGRVARIGAKWSVIHSNGPDRLVVWGDARTEQKPPVAFEILRTYRRLQDAGERAQR